MRFIVLSILLITCHTLQAQTQGTKKKSSVNTNMYEAEEPKDTTKSFTAKVRVVRDISDDPEVMFEGDGASGIYTVPRRNKDFAAMLKKLEQSREPGGPSVTVSADEDKNIKSVDLNKSTKGFVPPSDPNQKWDLQQFTK
ncbi:MAG TPA: hypothetical protein VN132_06210 [Bdellovibrio sp.]|nr:hypothetical protein [Bdellovibrio sp.]